MNLAHLVGRVSVVSTGHVQIRSDHESSSWRPTAPWLLASRQWTGPRPINAYVIEHGDGLVLFDTGQDRASVTEPDDFPGGLTRLLYDRVAPIRHRPPRTSVHRGLCARGPGLGVVDPDRHVEATVVGPMTGLKERATGPAR